MIISNIDGKEEKTRNDFKSVNNCVPNKTVLCFAACETLKVKWHKITIGILILPRTWDHHHQHTGGSNRRRRIRNKKKFRENKSLHSVQRIICTQSADVDTVTCVICIPNGRVSNKNKWNRLRFIVLFILNELRLPILQYTISTQYFNTVTDWLPHLHRQCWQNGFFVFCINVALDGILKLNLKI